MRMYIGLIFVTLVCYLNKRTFCTYADPVSSHTYHQCSCQSDCKVNVTCESDSATRWIGFRAFGYGWFESDLNCSSAPDSSFVLPPGPDNCTKNLTTVKQILGKLSGKVTLDTHDKFNIFNYCPLAPDYFKAQFDCVRFNDPLQNGSVIDSKCQNYIATSQWLSIYNEDFPEIIRNTGIRSCNCTIRTNASSLVLQTYDNRLSLNQTLALTHTNGTIIKQWKNTTSFAEMLSTDTIDIPNEKLLLLHWENRASEIGGQLWIAIKSLNQDDSITLICSKNISTSSTTPTMTTSATTRSNTTRQSNASSASATTTPSTSNTSRMASNSTADLRNSAATSKTTSSTRAPNTDIKTDPSKEVKKKPPASEKKNLGAIIGGVIGGLFFLILLIVLCVICCIKKKKRAVEPSQQPSNSRFKSERNTKDNLHDDGAFENKNPSWAKTNSDPSRILPPLPNGRLVDNVQINSGLPDFNSSTYTDVKTNGQASDAGKDFMTHDALYAKLIGNTDDNTNTGVEKSQIKGQSTSDINDFGNNIRDASVIQTDQGEVEGNGKKKKKKKKKRRKRTTIEALLDEEVTPDVDKGHHNQQSLPVHD